MLPIFYNFIPFKICTESLSMPNAINLICDVLFGDNFCSIQKEINIQENFVD